MKIHSMNKCFVCGIKEGNKPPARFLFKAETDLLCSPCVAWQYNVKEELNRIAAEGGRRHINHHYHH